MALVPVRYPSEGVVIPATMATGNYTNGSSVITSGAHGLVNSEVIYIASGQSVGFWYIVVLSPATFSIQPHGLVPVVTFYGAGTFTYFKIYRADWHCVHLPIVYKLSSTLWPINTVDTIRTVSSFANDNGYVKLTLSGAVKSDVSELEFVELTGATSGVYQILGFYSTSIITIDLAYNSNLTFGTVQYYYRNYRAKIRIYAGLPAAHSFQAVKPDELITEISVVPDSDSFIVVNIADFIKDKINILNNNLNSATLPNNIDAFCAFHVTYAEAYDYSAGGYGILDYVGSYSADSYVGYAVNAQLPFKNIYSGSLADYMMSYSAGVSIFTGKFLTPSLYPRISVGQYFDISFLRATTSAITVRREVLLRGVVQNVFSDSIPSYSEGIYRYAVSQSIYLEDQIKLTVYQGSTLISQEISIEVDNTCYTYAINLSWLNYLGGFDYWTFKGFADYGVNIQGTREIVKNIFPEWPNSYGASADTIRQENSRTSNQTIVVRAENLTRDQVDDLFRIKTSPLVMIVPVSGTDRRTVIPDASSFVYHPQANKLFDLSFTLTLTDDLPVQKA